MHYSKIVDLYKSANNDINDLLRVAQQPPSVAEFNAANGTFANADDYALAIEHLRHDLRNAARRVVEDAALGKDADYQSDDDLYHAARQTWPLDECEQIGGLTVEGAADVAARHGTIW